jgi:hypothetical protein
LIRRIHRLEPCCRPDRPPGRACSVQGGDRATTALSGPRRSRPGRTRSRRAATTHNGLLPRWTAWSPRPAPRPDRRRRDRPRPERRPPSGLGAGPLPRRCFRAPAGRRDRRDRQLPDYARPRGHHSKKP